MATRGRYFAICCVDDSAIEIVNNFLTEAYSAKDGDPALIAISNLDKKYTEPTQPPVDSFASPFTGKDASECSKLIYDMTASNKSDLNYEYLVILDKRSSKDKTARVVQRSDPEEEPRSLRAVFSIVNIILLSMVSKGLFDDCKENADRASDGVLRY